MDIHDAENHVLPNREADFAAATPGVDEWPDTNLRSADRSLEHLVNAEAIRNAIERGSATVPSTISSDAEITWSNVGIGPEQA